MADNIQNTITGKNLMSNVSSAMNSFETTSAINKLLDTSKAKQSLADASGPDLADLASLDGSKWTERELRSNPVKADFKKQIIDKVVAIASLVGSTTQSIIPSDMLAELSEEKKSEIKLFSMSMLALKALGLSHKVEDISGFIQSEITLRKLDDTDMNARDAHSIIEKTLHSKLEKEVLPLIDNMIPGGINSIKFITNAINSQATI